MMRGLSSKSFPEFLSLSHTSKSYLVKRTFEMCNLLIWIREQTERRCGEVCIPTLVIGPRMVGYLERIDAAQADLRLHELC